MGFGRRARESISIVNEMRDEFLSEEDLDLANLSEEELYTVWNAWLLQAQTTNEQDAHLYSHGVFEREPPWEDEPPTATIRPPG